MSEDFNRLHASRKYLGKCTMSQKIGGWLLWIFACTEIMTFQLLLKRKG